MDLDNINEAESLIKKLRIVQNAKSSVDEMGGEDGGSPETFAIVEKDTGITIKLPQLKCEALEVLIKMIDDQHDKILARIREL